MISRDFYLNKLIEYQSKNFIKVITGIRRCGKSSILKMYDAYLRSQNSQAHTVYLDLDNILNRHIQTEDDLANTIMTELGSLEKNGEYHVLLDEVQRIAGWEKVVNGLHATSLVNVIITGSNATLLSSELATLLTGRYVEIEVLPLSFAEFLKFKQVGSDVSTDPNPDKPPETKISKDRESESGKIIDTNKLDRSYIEAIFQEYVNFGGFPATVLAGSGDLKRDYLNSLSDSIIVRDIITKYQLKDVDVFHRIVRFLFEMIGKPIEVKNILNTIQSSGGKSSYESINNYISALMEAFVFYPIEQFNLKGKKRLVSGKRYYLADVGIRNVVVPISAKNMGSILENIVCLELLRRGYKVYAGSVATGSGSPYEIDFVAEKDKQRIYYQVSLSLMNDSTREREFRSLKLIRNNYPKYILSLDNIDFSENGIINRNLIDFLLDV